MAIRLIFDGKVYNPGKFRLQDLSAGIVGQLKFIKCLGCSLFQCLGSMETGITIYCVSTADTL